MRSVQFPPLHGGAPALDFVDTVDPRLGPDARDFLTSPQALSAWSEYAGLAGAVELDEDGLLRALELRETLYRIFLAIAERREPAPSDLLRFHAEYAATIARAELVRRTDRYT